MTVKELIETLQKEDPARLVVMARDAEGNGYSPLSDVSTASYVAETTYRGYVGPEKWSPELGKQGYAEEDVVKGQPALVLHPIN